MKKLNKFIITYYKRYPEDMTEIEKIEETVEDKTQLLAHVHVIKVEPYSDKKAEKLGLIEAKKVAKKTIKK